MDNPDYSRQASFINPERFKGVSVSIIGCGATGSHAAVMLAQSGFGNHVAKTGTMRVFDFDTVEKHNLPNQAFFPKHIGMNKAEALQDRIREQTGFEIDAFPVKVVDQHVVQADYVFLLVDSMAARKQIFEDILENSITTSLVIETRMGLSEGRVYAFNPNDKAEVALWKSSLYSDDVAETSSCGTSMSCALTASTIANLAVTRMIQYIDWTIGMKYLQNRGYCNDMPVERIFSLFPEMIIA